MQSSQLDKAINIMRRTGGRLIIVDQGADEAIVMMSVDDYEKLLNSFQAISGLSEREMIEKINRDIALWRAHNESDTLKWYNGGISVKRDDNHWQDDSVVDEVSTFAPSNLGDNWNDSRMEEESLDDVFSEPEEEPQFYMEPIE